MTTDPHSMFIFSGHTWSPEEREATFSYKVSHNGETFDFTEKLKFPQEPTLSNLPEGLLKNILDNVLLALGVSYYKLFCPRTIILEDINLSKEQGEFWNTVYTKGLGEFFYQNQIDFRGLITFPISEGGLEPIPFSRQNRSLVGIGGGKDSIVSAELLKTNGKSFTNFVINRHSIRDEVIKLVGNEVLTVRREFDPQLFELNKRSDTYNGHIPVSSQYAFIGVLLGALYDYRNVVVSNEHSANYGNVIYHDMEINHQWSKSYEFEKLFQDYVKSFITPDIIYFSLLRGFTEIAIVKQFVTHPQYFEHFSSCNRNFRITGEGSTKKWCGECPKCAFAFSLLAAFLSKEEVTNIFGDNLFAKESLMQTYKELLGVAAIKPFDCVGTPDEVRVAFYLASQKGEYNEDIVMKMFENEVLPNVENIGELQKKVFEVGKEHRVPEEFLEVI